MTNPTGSVTEFAFLKLALGIKQFFSKQGLFFSIWPYRILRLALSTLFIWSGISKLQDPLSFSILIDSYGLIPETWTPAVSYGLPLLEVTAGAGLLFDFRGNLSAITILLICFIFILGYGIHMGLDVDCGCFGPEDPEAKAYHGLRSAFYRDIVLMGIIIYLYIWRYRHSYVPQQIRGLIKTIKRR